MTAIEPLLRQPIAQAIAWALLQFVWQGALIGLITAVALAALKRSAADVRYVVATIALSLMLTMPVMTAVQSWRSAPGAQPAAADVSSSVHADVPVIGSPDAASPVATSGVSVRHERAIERAAIVDGALLSRDAVDRLLPALLLVWLVGVSLLTLRLVSGWLWIQHLRTHGAPAGDDWQAMAVRLGRRLHISRGVQLLESSLVEVPTVIGWMKPVILLPASVLAGLSPQQLEAILAHELAHIRRQDYVVNLLQTLVETLLFYHPAVWWLSRRIRVERENCCDDIAVSLCGDPYTYARALADLEERRGTHRGLALAATGGSLLQRVRRVLGAPTSHAGRGPGWLAGTAAVLVMGGIVAGAVGNGIMDAQQASTEAPALPAIAPVAPRAVEAATDPVVVRRRRLQHGELEHQLRLALQRAAATQSKEAQEQYAQIARIYAAARSAEKATEAELVAAAEAMRRVVSSVTAVQAPGEPAIAPAAAVAQSEPAVATTGPAIAAVPPAIATAPPAIAATTPPLAQTSVNAVANTVSVVRSSQDEQGNFVWENDGEKLNVNYRGRVEFADDDTDVKRLSPGGYLKIKEGGRVGEHTVEFRADSAGNITRRYWAGTSERPFDPEGRQWLARVLPRFIRQTAIGAEARVGRILKSSGTAGVLAEVGRIEGSWAKRVYMRELVRQAPMDSATSQKALAQAGREIESDFELASLLIEGADKWLADDGSRKAYFDAARTIESDFELRRVYSSALKRGPVSPAILAGILDASRSIDSDFELASLLEQIVKLQALDPTARAAFFAALGTVESDFEHRRVLAALAARSDLTPEIVGAMVDSAITLQSDFELATLLTAMVKRHGVEGSLRAPFFRAVQSIESSFERGRVLQELARRPELSEETVLHILKAVQGMSSGHEASQVLLTVAAGRPISGAARDLYIDAAGNLGDYEQGRVLTALVKNERRR